MSNEDVCYSLIYRHRQIVDWGTLTRKGGEWRRLAKFTTQLVELFMKLFEIVFIQ